MPWKRKMEVTISGLELRDSIPIVEDQPGTNAETDMATHMVLQYMTLEAHVTNNRIFAPKLY